MKKLFVVFILSLGVVIVAFSFSELETILLTLQKAKLRYFILALIIQSVWFVANGRMYQSVFHLLGLHDNVITLTRIATAATFINTVAPTGGAGGVALF